VGKLIDLSAHFQSRQNHEAAWQTFEDHTAGCEDGCGQDRLCVTGQQAAAQVWNTADPAPRRSAPDNRRRRSS
jgi:hypothetical protein